MAHGAKIGGVNYSISGGKVRVGGTNYKIAKGKTRIGGTNYNINFGLPYPPVFKTNTSSNYIISSTKNPEFCACDGTNIICGRQELNDITVHRSTDYGVTWSAITLPDSIGLGNRFMHAMVYGNGRFVIVGSVTYDYDDDDEPLDKVVSWVSTNGGVSWTEYDMTYPVATVYSGELLKFINGKFVYIDQTTAGINIRNSSDGITWASTTSRFGSRSNSSIAYGDGTYVVINNTKVFTSTNLTSWTSRYTFSYSYGTVFYFQSAFWAVMTYNSKLYIYKSTDKGVTWSSVVSGTSVSYSFSDTVKSGRSAAFEDFLVIKGVNDNNIFVSNNATTWTQISLSSSVSTNFMGSDEPEGNMIVTMKGKTTCYAIP